MPYLVIDDLPDSVRGVLPERAQDIFLSAFNSAFNGASCKDREDRDACATKVAWSAVKREFRQDGEGSWNPIPIGERGNTVTDGELEQFSETAISSVRKGFIREDGSGRIRIIKPGWGSSGYYSEAMLERDAAKVYRPGTHQHLDHQTAQEARDKPERSLRDLVAVITGNVAYERNVPEPGVYADVQVFSPYRGFLNEMAPYIGVSHVATGTSKPGEAEGRKGQIIESLEKCHSVDYVTLPGAGGGLTPLAESYRAWNKPNNEQTKEETTMTELTKESLKHDRPDLIESIRADIVREIQESETEKKKAADLVEAQKKIKDYEIERQRWQEGQAIQDAKAIITEALKNIRVPELAKPRIAEALVSKVTLKDGKLDEVKFKTDITEAMKAETEFYAKLMETGKVKGFGQFGGGAHRPEKAGFARTPKEFTIRKEQR